MSETRAPYHISGRLYNKLLSVLERRLTILVAPTGYGKTSAVRRLMEISAEYEFVWLSARNEGEGELLDNLRNELARFDKNAADELARAYERSSLSPQQIARALNAVKPAAERGLCLVIDNVNSITRDLHPAIINGFLTQENPGFHALIIGRPFLPSGARFDRFAVNWIGETDLMLHKADIQDLFRTQRGDLTLEEADAIFEQTQGWPVAVHACLAQLLRGDRTPPRETVFHLFAQASFDALSREEQRLLMGLSITGQGTQADVEAFCRDEEQMPHMREMLLGIPLLQSDVISNTYRLPEVLRAFLALRLSNASQATRQAVYRAAGKRFERRGSLPEAIACYDEIQDNEAILSLDLKLLSFSMIGSKPVKEVARDLIARCPVDVMRRHPISVLRLAYLLFAAGDTAGYLLALNKAAPFMRREEEPGLHGEWLVMSMLQHLPDLPKMHAVLREAEGYLQGPAQCIAPEEPLLFGSPSMWYLFYKEPGKGDEIAAQLEAWQLDYQRLTGGRGAGASLLYQGELASMRCQFDRSEAFLNMAQSQAEDALQPTIAYGCAMLMARNAIMHRDVEGVRKALSYIDKSSRLFERLRDTALHHAMAGTVRVLILSMMREVGMQNELTRTRLEAIGGEAILTQMTLHLRVYELFEAGDFRRAVGEMQAAVQRGSRLSNPVMQYVTGMVIAGYHWSNNRPEEAAAAMSSSLQVAVDDGLYAMYVNHWEFLKPLLQHKALAQFKPFVDKVESLYKALEQNRGPEALDGPAIKLPDTLSAREREVAILAARGLTNPEIAGQLYVTVSTVKKHLVMVFNKLGIDRRSKLIEMLKK